MSQYYNKSDDNNVTLSQRTKFNHYSRIKERMKEQEDDKQENEVLDRSIGRMQTLTYNLKVFYLQSCLIGFKTRENLQSC